ncbi:MAG: putative lipid II flippase FtsW [Oscillospiraceae bacterium]
MAKAATKNDASQPKQQETQSPVKKRIGNIDIPLLIIVILLLSYGLIMLFSASYPRGLLYKGDRYYYITRQLIFAAAGLVIMFVVSMIDYRIWKKFAWAGMTVSIILLIIVLFMRELNGTRRWIIIGTYTFQPSELAKFALIVLFAALIAKNQKRIKTFKYGFAPFIVILAILALLLVAEPHLSATILILGIGVGMMFAGGSSIRWMGLAAVISVVGLYLAITVFPDQIPYASTRIATWRDPFSSDQNDAHQTIQSLIAVGSGGFFGRGIGQSRQKFLYLPEMFNDYIYAIISEELGFIGAMAVVVLFLVLLGRCLYIAVRVKDKFGSMLVVGVSIQIALQAFLHVAVNLNAIPSTGISLPFFSAGGTALLMILTQMGVVFSVARRANLEQAIKQEEERAGMYKVPPGNPLADLRE